MSLHVITPESQLRRPGEFLRCLIRDVLAARELGWRLLVRNVSAQYRQTLLGYVWAFLPPLATTAIWVFLNSQQIVRFESPGVPYAAFALIGLLLWQTFVDAVQTPLRVANESRQMLAKINFPREALLLTAVGEVLFNFLVRLVLLIGVFTWYGLPLSLGAFSAVIGVVMLIAFGTVLGILLVPWGLLYQDFGRGIVLILQFWLYLTPVVYPAAETGTASLLNWVNPVSPLILATRDWLLAGQTTHLPAFSAVSAVATVAAIVGLVIYRLSMPILIERMAAG